MQALESFCASKKFCLRIKPANKLSKRELTVEKNYWKKFYRNFTHYLYEECGYYDNYAGLLVKSIRTFFGYLEKEKGIKTGGFHK